MAVRGGGNGVGSGDIDWRARENVVVVDVMVRGGCGGGDRGRGLHPILLLANYNNLSVRRSVGHGADGQ